MVVKSNKGHELDHRLNRLYQFDLDQFNTMLLLFFKKNIYYYYF